MATRGAGARVATGEPLLVTAVNVPWGSTDPPLLPKIAPMPRGVRPVLLTLELHLLDRHPWEGVSVMQGSQLTMTLVLISIKLPRRTVSDVRRGVSNLRLFPTSPVFLVRKEPMLQSRGLSSVLLASLVPTLTNLVPPPAYLVQSILTT